MPAEPALVHRAETSCNSCGLPSVIRIDDRPMCGHCFHLGIPPVQSRRLHRWPAASSYDEGASIEQTVRAALDEFNLLKQRVELVLQDLEK